MGLLKKLAGETVLYGASSILGRFLNYLLVPLYTAVFSPGEYGIVTELYAYVAFLNILYVYGLETAYFRFSTKEGHDEKNVFNSCFTAILVTSVIFSLALSLFSTEIALLLEYPGKNHLIIWLAAILAIDAVVAIPFARLRLQNRAQYFVLVKLISIFVNIALNLFFLIYLPYRLNNFGPLPIFLEGIYNPSWGVEYIFISNLVANGLILFMLLPTGSKLKLHFSLSTISPLLKYAYPFIFVGLAGVTNEMLSRAILKYRLPIDYYDNLSSIAALGIFGACYKLAVFMTLAVQAFRYAAEPFFFAHAEQKNSPVIFARVMHWYIIFACFIFISISINLDIIGVVFLRNPEFREGLYIVPYLLMGGLFLGIYYNLSIWYKLTDKTLYGAVLSGIGAIVTIAFNIILIPYLGFLGSAITTLLTYSVMSLLSYTIGKKHLEIPYKVGKAIFYIFFAFIIVFSSTYLEELYSAWIIRIGMIVAFLFTILILERETLYEKTFIETSDDQIHSED
ncbi:MAG: oligosaccharide flippase family protein [Bacteroidetes bacterium]|nr:oligosaccharide flippase family protein [Bacteroidota bacterium]MDA1120283.1 oligosaccharide flippase family protein [Bacteroidota bacterium]